MRLRTPDNVLKQTCTRIFEELVLITTFVPIGVLLLRGLSRQQSGRSTITPPFSETC